MLFKHFSIDGIIYQELNGTICELNSNEESSKLDVN